LGHNEDDIQVNLLFIEFLKERNNGDEDDDSNKKFKIMLDQLLKLSLYAFS
jgi:hypothetical protein